MWTFQGPAATIALKLLEEKNKDEYICAFLQSPVSNLSHYRKSKVRSLSLSITTMICLDAVYTERLNGLKENFQSVRKQKQRSFDHRMDFLDSVNQCRKQDCGDRSWNSRR